RRPDTCGGWWCQCSGCRGRSLQRRGCIRGRASRRSRYPSATGSREGSRGGPCPGGRGCCRPRGRRRCARPTRESRPGCRPPRCRSEEHTSELQSRENLVCRLLLEKKKKISIHLFFFISYT